MTGMVVKVRRYLPARLLAKDYIISVLNKIKGLGLLPIVNDTSPGIPAFITLDGALDPGEVKIREVNQEGTGIQNRSSVKTWLCSYHFAY